MGLVLCGSLRDGPCFLVRGWGYSGALQRCEGDDLDGATMPAASVVFITEPATARMGFS